MNYRKLRIAWSVGWGVVAVLLCVLSVQSYYRMYSGVRVDATNQRATYFWSDCGDLTLKRGTWFPGDPHPTRWDVAGRDRAISMAEIMSTRNPWFRDRFRWISSANGFTLKVPYWFLAVVCGTVSGIGVVPWWIRWPIRFSLRTLLIATTLVAVVLGLVVWATG